MFSFEIVTYQQITSWKRTLEIHEISDGHSDQKLVFASTAEISLRCGWTDNIDQTSDQ